VKLPLREPEHEALREELARWDGHVASALLAVEATRACARYGPEYAEQARRGIEHVALVPIDHAVLDRARDLHPPALRTLDAIHLASALTIAADVGVFVAYDERLLAAAAAHGLPVAAPS
jgi:uncharacterized protein